MSSSNLIIGNSFIKHDFLGSIFLKSKKNNTITIDPDLGFFLNGTLISAPDGSNASTSFLSNTMDKRIVLDSTNDLTMSKLDPNTGDIIYSNYYGLDGVKVSNDSVLQIGDKAINYNLLKLLTEYFYLPSGDLKLPSTNTISIGTQNLTNTSLIYLNSTIPSKFTTLDSKVLALETTINSLDLNNTIPGFTSSINTLQTNEAANTIKINDLISAQGLLSVELTTYKNKLDTTDLAHTLFVNSTTTQLSDIENKITDLTTKSNSYNTSITSINTNLTNLNDVAIPAIQSQLDALIVSDAAQVKSADFVVVKDRVAVNEADILSLKSKDIVHTNDILDLSGRVTLNEDDIVTLKDRIDDIDLSITDINTINTTQNGDITALKAKDVLLDGSITTINTSITSILSDISDNSDDITALKAKDIVISDKVAVLENDLGLVDSRIVNLENAGGPDPVVLPFYLKTSDIDFGENKTKITNTNLTTDTITLEDQVLNKTNLLSYNNLVSRFSVFNATLPDTNSRMVYQDIDTGKLKYSSLTLADTVIPVYVKTNELLFSNLGMTNKTNFNEELLTMRSNVIDSNEDVFSTMSFNAIDFNSPDFISSVSSIGFSINNVTNSNTISLGYNNFSDLYLLSSRVLTELDINTSNKFITYNPITKAYSNTTIPSYLKTDKVVFNTNELNSTHLKLGSTTLIESDIIKSKALNTKFDSYGLKATVSTDDNIVVYNSTSNLFYHTPRTPVYDYLLPSSIVIGSTLGTVNMSSLQYGFNLSNSYLKYNEINLADATNAVKINPRVIEFNNTGTPTQDNPAVISFTKAKLALANRLLTATTGTIDSNSKLLSYNTVSNNYLLTDFPVTYDYLKTSTIEMGVDTNDVIIQKSKISFKNSTNEITNTKINFADTVLNSTDLTIGTTENSVLSKSKLSFRNTSSVVTDLTFTKLSNLNLFLSSTSTSGVIPSANKVILKTSTGTYNAHTLPNSYQWLKENEINSSNIIINSTGISTPSGIKINSLTNTDLLGSITIDNSGIVIRELPLTNNNGTVYNTQGIFSVEDSEYNYNLSHERLSHLDKLGDFSSLVNGDLVIPTINRISATSTDIVYEKFSKIGFSCIGDNYYDFNIGTKDATIPGNSGATLINTNGMYFPGDDTKLTIDNTIYSKGLTRLGSVTGIHNLITSSNICLKNGSINFAKLDNLGLTLYDILGTNPLTIDYDYLIKLNSLINTFTISETTSKLDLSSVDEVYNITLSPHVFIIKNNTTKDKVLITPGTITNYINDKITNTITSSGFSNFNDSKRTTSLTDVGVNIYNNLGTDPVTLDYTKLGKLENLVKDYGYSSTTNELKLSTTTNTAQTINVNPSNLSIVNTTSNNKTLVETASISNYIANKLTTKMDNTGFSTYNTSGLLPIVLDYTKFGKLENLVKDYSYSSTTNALKLSTTSNTVQSFNVTPSNLSIVNTTSCNKTLVETGSVSNYLAEKITTKMDNTGYITYNTSGLLPIVLDYTKFGKVDNLLKDYSYSSTTNALKLSTTSNTVQSFNVNPSNLSIVNTTSNNKTLVETASVSNYLANKLTTKMDNTGYSAYNTAGLLPIVLDYTKFGKIDNLIKGHTYSSVLNELKMELSGSTKYNILGHNSISLNDTTSKLELANNAITWYNNGLYNLSIDSSGITYQNTTDTGEYLNDENEKIDFTKARVLKKLSEIFKLYTNNIALGGYFEMYGQDGSTLFIYPGEIYMKGGQVTTNPGSIRITYTGMKTYTGYNTPILAYTYDNLGITSYDTLGANPIVLDYTKFGKIDKLLSGHTTSTTVNELKLDATASTSSGTFSNSKLLLQDTSTNDKTLIIPGNIVNYVGNKMVSKLDAGGYSAYNSTGTNPVTLGYDSITNIANLISGHTYSSSVNNLKMLLAGNANSSTLSFDKISTQNSSTNNSTQIIQGEIGNYLAGKLTTKMNDAGFSIYDTLGANPNILDYTKLGKINSIINDYIPEAKSLSLKLPGADAYTVLTNYSLTLYESELSGYIQLSPAGLKIQGSVDSGLVVGDPFLDLDDFRKLAQIADKFTTGLYGTGYFSFSGDSSRTTYSDSIYMKKASTAMNNSTLLMTNTGITFGGDSTTNSLSVNGDTVSLASESSGTYTTRSITTHQFLSNSLLTIKAIPEVIYSDTAYSNVSKNPFQIESTFRYGKVKVLTNVYKQSVILDFSSDTSHNTSVVDGLKIYSPALGGSCSVNKSYTEIGFIIVTPHSSPQSPLYEVALIDSPQCMTAHMFTVSSFSSLIYNKIIRISGASTTTLIGGDTCKLIAARIYNHGSSDVAFNGKVLFRYLGESQ